MHGIPGNHFLAPDGNDVQLTDPGFLRAPSIYAALHAAGVPVLAVTTKDKLRAAARCRRRAMRLGRAAPSTGVRGWHAAADAVGRPAPAHLRLGLPLHYALELGLALSVADADPAPAYVSLTDAVQHAAAARLGAERRAT